MLDEILNNINMSEDSDTCGDSDVTSLDNGDLSLDSPTDTNLYESTTKSLINHDDIYEIGSLYQSVDIETLSDNGISLDDSPTNLLEQEVTAQSVDNFDSKVSVIESDMYTPETAVAASSLDIDNLTNVPHTESLDISQDQLDTLNSRAEGIERPEHGKEISFGKKWCPTRHGCQGATDCDYCGGDYPG